MQHRLTISRLPVLALAPLLVAFAAACSGGEDAAAPPAAMGPSGTRFLMASEKGITETSAAAERTILKYNDGSYLLDPVVSPDGKKLAFIRQPSAKVYANGGVDFGSDLYVADRDGRNAREIVRHESVAEFVRTPAWLPGGDELLYSVRGRLPTGEADFRIERIDLRSGRRVRLVANAIDPVVSPDATRIAYVAIAFTDQESLTVSDLLGQNSRVVVSSDFGLALMSSIVWSPDGKQIAFAAVDARSPAPPPAPTPRRPQTSLHPFAQDVWVVDATGGNLRRVADIAINAPSIAWSRDGSAFFVLGATGFFRVDAKTGAQQQIGDGVALAQIVRLD